MLKKMTQPKGSFWDIYRGIPKEIWILSIVSLINRIGAMVIPFLSIYLSDSKGFTLHEIGWIMTAFGVGSVVGSWLGGKLTDRIGFYPVIVFSLLTSGIGLIILKDLDSFMQIALGFFLVILLSDILRPPVFVAVNNYCNEENRTRSITLVRLAINLGFAFGPATGGMLIASFGYASLFWVDGLSCILAMLFFILTLKKPINALSKEEKKEEDSSVLKSPYKDKSYLLFVLSLTLFGLVFIQYFSTVPLFYKDVHDLSEATIGLIISSNGFIIFLLEMPLMHWIEKQKKASKMNVMMIAVGCVIISYMLLMLSFDVTLLVVGMIFLTIGEMLMFPLSNTEAMQRSLGKNQGDYMALYAISFSIAHLIGHNLGMQSVDFMGFNLTWVAMSIGLVVCLFLLQLYKQSVKKEKELELN